MSPPLKTFIIYSSKDRELREDLERHLLPLTDLGWLSIWSDKEILPGERWDATIKKQLKAAELFLMLVSVDFYNSGYIREEEFKSVVERLDAGDALVIPIIVRDCTWEYYPIIKDLQVLPQGGFAITDTEHWSTKEKAWAHVVKKIAERVKALLTEREAAETARVEAEQKQQAEAEALSRQQTLEQEDRAAWQNALAAGTIAAFDSYLSQYRLHAEEALARRSGLKEREQQEEVARRGAAKEQNRLAEAARKAEQRAAEEASNAQKQDEQAKPATEKPRRKPEPGGQTRPASLTQHQEIKPLSKWRWPVLIGSIALSMAGIIWVGLGHLSDNNKTVAENEPAVKSKQADFISPPDHSAKAPVPDSTRLSKIIKPTLSRSATSSYFTRKGLSDQVAKRYLGRHMVSSYIYTDKTERDEPKYGEVFIEEKDGNLLIKGVHGNKIHIYIDGYIDVISERKFNFKGRVHTDGSVWGCNGPIDWNGDVTFLAAGTRRFWRANSDTYPFDCNCLCYFDIIW